MSRFAVERVDDLELKTVPMKRCYSPSNKNYLTGGHPGHPPVLQLLYI